MERQTIELIKPSAGHWLWREDDGVRLFYRAVMNGNAEDYQECTTEEKEAYEEEQQRIADEALAQAELEREQQDREWREQHGVD